MTISRFVSHYICALINHNRTGYNHICYRRRNTTSEESILSSFQALTVELHTDYCPLPTDYAKSKGLFSIVSLFFKRKYVIKLSSNYPGSPYIPLPPSNSRNLQTKLDQTYVCFFPPPPFSADFLPFFGLTSIHTIVNLSPRSSLTYPVQLPSQHDHLWVRFTLHLCSDQPQSHRVQLSSHQVPANFLPSRHQHFRYAIDLSKSLHIRTRLSLIKGFNICLFGKCDSYWKLRI